MQVLALNGSPHGARGNTSMILDPFVQGLEEAGARATVVQLRGLQINPCLGDYHCWVKMPGTCHQKDDVASLLPEVDAADILVLATPVYFDGMTGLLKNSLDRLLPLLHHSTFEIEGRLRHPLRYERSTLKESGGRLVLVATCGFHELETFNPLVEHVKAAAVNLSRRYAGALLRPHAGFLFAMERMGFAVADVFAAAREAGRHLALNGVMPEDQLRLVSRELLPKASYVELLNARFALALAKAEG